MKKIEVMKKKATMKAMSHHDGDEEIIAAMKAMYRRQRCIKLLSCLLCCPSGPDTAPAKGAAAYE